MNWRNGVVKTVLRTWPGVQELGVDVAGKMLRALCYTHIVGQAEVGDDVVITTNALQRGLGTGGYGFVAAIPSNLPADPPPAPGHVMKARYTPLQTMVLGVDEQESSHHSLLAEADDVAGMPIIVADLHSALPAIIAGLRWYQQEHNLEPVRICYVMDDGAALPAWFSRSLAQLRADNWLTSVITAGQSFGGDYDSVNIHTGLLAAKHVVRADVTIVSQGPGNLGTGTRWGFTGTSAGEAINAAGVLGGYPIGSLRMSAADPRPRHQGISHHSLTAYGRVAIKPAVLPLPTDWEAIVASPEGGGRSEAEITALQERISQQVPALTPPHRIEPVSARQLMLALAATPMPLNTMGRGLTDDALPFLAAAVAGVHAGQVLASVRDCEREF